MSGLWRFAALVVPLPRIWMKCENYSDSVVLLETILVVIFSFFRQPLEQLHFLAASFFS